jgi:hypothetical protein
VNSLSFTLSTCFSISVHRRRAWFAVRLGTRAPQSSSHSCRLDVLSLSAAAHVDVSGTHCQWPNSPSPTTSDATVRMAEVLHLRTTAEAWCAEGSSGCSHLRGAGLYHALQHGAVVTNAPHASLHHARRLHDSTARL